MTIDQLQRQLSDAVAEEFAPPTRVTAAQVYQAGLRRRRARRWFSVAVVTVTAAGVTGGATALAVQRAAESPAQIDAGSVPVGQGWSTCKELADEVWAVTVTALPGDARLLETELPPGQDSADCSTGGLFWAEIRYDEQKLRLGFEGGTGMTESACDPARRPARCERFPGGEIGHLGGSDEYGVLYQRDRGGVYFFLGLPDGGADHQLTTDQLAAAASRIGDKVFG